MSTVHKEERFADTAPSPNYADLIIQGLKEAKVEIVASLPESLLKKVYPMLEQDEQIRYIQVSRSTCPGSWLVPISAASERS